MNIKFNKIMSLIIGVNIFCALITLIYFMFDYFHPNTIYSDKQMITVIMIMVISMIMIATNHYSKQVTLSLVSSKSKK